MPVDVLVPLSTPTRVDGPWRFVRETPAVRPRRSPGSPPRLTPECTVLDLLACRGEDEAVGLVTSAVQKGLTTPERLGRFLNTRPRQRHRRLIVALLTEVSDGVRSFLELRYRRDVERAHGLPHADRQSSHTDLPYQRDVKYKRYALIVELDGRIGHTGEGRFRDMNPGQSARPAR